MKEYLRQLFTETSTKLDYLKDVELIFDVPKNKEFGDLSTNVAMLLTRALKRKPREIAQEIIDNLELDNSKIIKVEIAGPGFLNFYVNAGFANSIISVILEEGENFGKSDKFAGKTANVEFVSANPTGPLTVGHARNAFLGDTIANLLEWIGYKVDREYYFNDAGNQMRNLGDSVRLRYLQLLGQNIDFPEKYYLGEYINDIAKSFHDEYGASLVNEEPLGKFKERAEQLIFDNIKTTLLNCNIKHDIYFNEKSLYDEGKINDLITEFEKRNLIYKQDNATFLKLSEMGREVDKVIVKSTGEPTYRLPDMAYHIVKLNRNYDLLVDVFGTDHDAEYPDVLGTLKYLGYDADKVKVIIYQFVNILKDNQIVKMSTRKANYITLDYLIEEVGLDVTRYFFLMRQAGTHLNFDLDLAKKQSDENPVFYLQYAHARICSIIGKTEEIGLKSSLEHLNLLDKEEEIELIKQLNQFKELILNSALNFEPHKICNYLEDLAAGFHKFYHFHRIIGSEENIASARLTLIKAVQIVLRNGLKALGISAPERM